MIDTTSREIPSATAHVARANEVRTARLLALKRQAEAAMPRNMPDEISKRIARLETQQRDRSANIPPEYIEALTRQLRIQQRQYQENEVVQRGYASQHSPDVPSLVSNIRDVLPENAPYTQISEMLCNGLIESTEDVNQVVAQLHIDERDFNNRVEQIRTEVIRRGVVDEGQSLDAHGMADLAIRVQALTEFINAQEMEVAFYSAEGPEDADERTVWNRAVGEVVIAYRDGRLQEPVYRDAAGEVERSNDGQVIDQIAHMYQWMQAEGIRSSEDIAQHSLQDIFAHFSSVWRFSLETAGVSPDAITQGTISDIDFAMASYLCNQLQEAGVLNAESADSALIAGEVAKFTTKRQEFEHLVDVEVIEFLAVLHDLQGKNPERDKNQLGLAEKANRIESDEIAEWRNKILARVYANGGDLQEIHAIVTGFRSSLEYQLYNPLPEKDPRRLINKEGGEGILKNRTEHALRAASARAELPEALLTAPRLISDILDKAAELQGVIDELQIANYTDDLLQGEFLSLQQTIGIMKKDGTAEAAEYATAKAQIARLEREHNTESTEYKRARDVISSMEKRGATETPEYREAGIRVERLEAEWNKRHPKGFPPETEEARAIRIKELQANHDKLILVYGAQIRKLEEKAPQGKWVNLISVLRTLPYDNTLLRMDNEAWEILKKGKKKTMAELIKLILMILGWYTSSQIVGEMGAQ